MTHFLQSDYNTSNKWSVLAGLRFFLAFIVVASHLTAYLPGHNTLVFSQIAKLGGNTAVIGFLLISGYSIANSLTRKSKNFYKRRFFRIYPLYSCSIFFSLLPFLFLGKEVQLLHEKLVFPGWAAIIGNLFFLQDFTVFPILANPVLWSLSVEVLCYALAPYFIKKSVRFLIFLIVVSACLYVVFPHLYRVLSHSTSFPHYAHFIYGVDFYLFLWAWLLGFLYFVVGEDKRIKVVVILLGCILLILNKNFGGRLDVITYIFASLTLMYAPYIKISKSVMSSLNYLGDISYPLYLFHLPTFNFLIAVLGINNPLVLVVSSLATSAFFYHTIDVSVRKK